MIKLFLQQRAIYERMLGDSHKLFDPDRDEAGVEAFIEQCADEFMTTFDDRLNDLRFGEKKTEMGKDRWRTVRAEHTLSTFADHNVKGVREDVHQLFL